MSMDDRDGKIWMDGQLVEWRDAKIHVLTHTLHYGCGAFEGVRAYNTVNGTAIFRLREHTERLLNSAKILRMKVPFSVDQLEAAQKEVVRANNLESCYLRPLTWIGSAETDLTLPMVTGGGSLQPNGARIIVPALPGVPGIPLTNYAGWLVVAGLYLTVKAEFIGVVQVLVYAGAIMVLGLYVASAIFIGLMTISGLCCARGRAPWCTRPS